MINREKLKQLDKVIEKEIEQGNLKDASVCVLYEEQQVFRAHYGKDRENSIYRLFSMTKPVTAVAAFILYERGLLDLQSPVSRYIPAFEKQQVWNGKELVPTKREVLVKDLLNMTAGIVYPNEDNFPAVKMRENLEQMYRIIENGGGYSVDMTAYAFGKAPLLFQPGEGWHYGACADVMGIIIEKISGEKLEDFFEKEIFVPLGMKDTGFWVNGQNRCRIADMYMHEAGKLVLADGACMKKLCTDNAAKEPRFKAGGSGLYGSMDDYIRFARMLYRGGELDGTRIIGEKTVHFMTSDQLTAAQKKAMYFESTLGYSYGNFFRIMDNLSEGCSNGSVGEYGWDGLAGTYFMVDPAEKLITVYMQQFADSVDMGLRRRIRQVIYGALE